MLRTTLLNNTTQTTATNNGGVDTSAMSSDFTLCLEVYNLVGNARFEFQDSVTNFSGDQRVLASVSVTGPLTSSAPKRFTFRQPELPFSRLGQSSSKVRIVLADITSGPADTVTYMAWMESANQ